MMRSESLRIIAAEHNITNLLKQIRTFPELSMPLVGTVTSLISADILAKHYEYSQTHVL